MKKVDVTARPMSRLVNATVQHYIEAYSTGVHKYAMRDTAFVNEFVVELYPIISSK